MRHPGFVHLLEAIEPGGRIRSVRRLKGGLGATVHAVDIETATGSRRRIVLRRYSHEGSDNTPERARYEAANLQVAKKAGIPAPSLLWLDADGEAFGVPALCVSYIAGASRYAPRNRGRWTAELARAASQIHAVTPDRYDLSALEPLGRPEMLADLLEPEPVNVVRDSADPLLREVYAVLLEELDRVELMAPRLIHNDYWPGNTVFNRGRLAAVIDWSDAKLGDPRVDIAQCEREIAFTLDLETGRQFREAYERIEAILPDFWYFQLYYGFFAMLWVDRWLGSYAEVGIPLDPSEVHAKLRKYVRHALDEAAAFANPR